MMTKILRNTSLSVLLLLLCSDAIKSASIDTSTEKLTDSVVPLVFPEDSTKYKIITTNVTDQGPPLLFPDDDKKYKIISGSPETLSIVPKEFPKDDKKIKIVLKNSSMILDKLPIVFPDDKTKFNIIPSNITIVKSLLHKDMSHMRLESIKSDISENSTRGDKNAEPNSNQSIQVPGALLEKDVVKHHEEVPGHVGRWVLVSLSAFTMLIVSGYAAFLTWKKRISSRSSSRHVLINEEDSVHDYKHSEF